MIMCVLLCYPVSIHMSQVQATGRPISSFLFNPFVVCHKYWEKLYELQHINLLSLYLPKEDGVSPDVEYITQQIIFSIFLQ